MAWRTCFLFQEHVLPSIDLGHDHHVGEMVHLVFQVNQSSALSTLQLVLNAPQHLDFVRVLIKECFNQRMVHFIGILLSLIFLFRNFYLILWV